MMSPLLTSHLDWACWVARLAASGRPVGSQFGLDLLLEVTVCGCVFYLPVSPGPGRDTWTIRTVLSEEQGLANLATQQEHIRTAWRQRKHLGGHPGRGRRRAGRAAPARWMVES